MGGPVQPRLSNNPGYARRRAYISRDGYYRRVTGKVQRVKERAGSPTGAGLLGRAHICISILLLSDIKIGSLEPLPHISVTNEAYLCLMFVATLDSLGELGLPAECRRRVHHSSIIPLPQSIDGGRNVEPRRVETG